MQLEHQHARPIRHRDIARQHLPAGHCRESRRQPPILRRVRQADMAVGQAQHPVVKQGLRRKGDCAYRHRAVKNEACGAHRLEAARNQPMPLPLQGDLQRDGR